MADTVTDSYLIPAERSWNILRQVAALNVQAASRLTGLQVELFALGIETGVAQARLLGLPGDYEQFCRSESKLASQYENRMFEISQETADVLLESGDELGRIFGDIFSVAKEGIANSEIVSAVENQEVKPVPKKPAKKKSAKKSR